MNRTEIACALALSCFIGPTTAATITITNHDDPGVGLNDTTPATPVGRNTGTTLGQQRRIAAQFAADIWGAQIQSPVEIKVQVTFVALQCNEFGGLIGIGGSNSDHRDFRGAPLSGTWYTQALANSWAGVDLNPDVDDIYTQFSSVIGITCASPFSFYYGLDGQLPTNAPPNPLDFVTVAIHEIGHGLGFSGSASFQAYGRFLEDHRTGKTFPEMNDDELVSAYGAGPDLHWVGENAIRCGNNHLTRGRDPSGHIEMHSSLIHLSPMLLPAQVMGPSAGVIPLNPDIELCMLRDIGWLLAGDPAPNLPPAPPPPPPPPPPGPGPHPAPPPPPPPPPVTPPQPTPEPILPAPVAPVDPISPPPPPPPGRLAPVMCGGKVANIVGTEGNDILIGTTGPDVIAGLGGNDVIRGLAGNDTICGGDGKDRLYGGPGRDKLYGGPGSDVCAGGSGKNTISSCVGR